MAPPAPSLSLTHTQDSHLEVAHAGQLLFRYVYVPQTDPFETRKPHFHPVRTLAGNLVTNYRPHDHLWHHGFAMTFAHISLEGPNGRGEAQNFWGGNSYIHGQGYQRLPHLVGSQRHIAWDAMERHSDRIELRHRVSWESFEGARWLDESRSWTVRAYPEERAGGRWTLDFESTLRNAATHTLHVGSPTTAGRPAAGYGGLMWRGPRSFFRGAILAAGDLEGPDVMGQSARWLAYTGKHDGTDGDAAATASPPAQTTVIFEDLPGSLRHPTKWFVRNDPYASVSFAVTFDRELTLAPGDSLTLKHRIHIAGGALTRDDIEGVTARNSDA